MVRYLIAVIVFFAIDMVWLGVVAKNFYQKQIGFLMTPDVKWWAALLFYFLFIVGLLVFVINPALEKKSIQHALAAGALFGLVTYATYDLTNLATIKNWPLLVTVVDLLWGATLSAAVAVMSFWLIRRFGV